MKIQNIIIGVLFTILCSACSDWFDVSPSTNIKESKLFENEQGFKDVLTGVYQIIASPTLYGKDLTFGYNDVRVRYWHNSTSSAAHSYNYAHLLDYSKPQEVLRFANIWSQMYKAISNLNGLLKNIDAKEYIFSPGNYSLIKGEAIALRAFLHFELLRFFSPSPAIDMEAKAIPYYTMQTVIPQPQKTINEVIELVRKDLKTAQDLMREYDQWGPAYDAESTESGSNRMLRMNYWATTGILARMELYAGNKAEALAAAKEVIGEPTDTPKLPIQLNASSTPSVFFGQEMLFLIDVPTLKEITDPLFGANATATSTSTGLTLSTTYLSFYNSISPTDAEFRRELWYTTASGTSSTLKKYTNQTRVPMMRVSELYLIAAEASDSNETGINYLNTIRAGRGLAPMDYNQNLTLRIKEEYMKEFPGEGQLWYYYKRLGSSTYGGPVNSNLSISADKYIVPIPVAEIEFGLIEN